ncbi:MAG TPA: FAD-dependent oxidoreductase [Dermatophilaceae bacterium]|jgi:3-phenylpropionate/trans-cinnamate dioxygenase ferredoxin reductase subunit|nr:FAD-dependent oxidoreductase [Dermatophilaceae bacterium]HPZ68084.1 FAD-dependent oxidoreductase [Dermatophilaceae bacterium]HQD00932.1 FAD-dependent oxidoreductase [Dermatophilaceae bacterium]
MNPIVVVGAGLAGATAVTALREGGHDGPLVLLGAESHPPYERPPLSKGYLLGNDPIESAFVHDRQWYAAHDIDLRTGAFVTDLDLGRKSVSLLDGTEIAYDQLLLATGSRPRRLPLADDSGVPTAYLRTIEDSDRIRAAFGPGHRIVIIGAGWIGLEVAAAARAAGTEVTVFEVAELPLLRVLGPRVAQAFADLHRAHGVDLRLGTAVSAADLAGATLVVVGVGVAPDASLAQGAGLAVSNGVLVDATLRTSHPDVYAVGDIANHDHPLLGRRVRVEHWDTAIEQAKVAAHNLVGGQEAEAYDRLPYFFTDQYDLGMEYVGYAAADADTEVVVRGDLGAEQWRAYWVSGGVVVAGMHVNEWGAIDEIREQIGHPLA